MVDEMLKHSRMMQDAALAREVMMRSEAEKDKALIQKWASILASVETIKSLYFDMSELERTAFEARFLALLSDLPQEAQATIVEALVQLAAAKA
jgi:hypothetical protein